MPGKPQSICSFIIYVYIHVELGNTSHLNTLDGGQAVDGQASGMLLKGLLPAHTTRGPSRDVMSNRENGINAINFSFSSYPGDHSKPT